MNADFGNVMITCGWGFQPQAVIGESCPDNPDNQETQFKLPVAFFSIITPSQNIRVHPRSSAVLQTY
jgi:hypothetical protein